LPQGQCFFIGGIQGKDGDNSYSLFKKHIVNNYKFYPWFFVPETSGSTDPKMVLEFKPTAIKIGGRGTVFNEKEGLESYIDYASTADEKKYDGEVLNFIHLDESGKLKKDINSRHEVLRPCVRQGTNRVGWMMYTTTVEETESDRKANPNIMESIERYRLLCEKSHYHDRDEYTGFTTSGLINLFFPADEAYEGMIDEYGFGDKEGARKQILSMRERYVRIGDFKNLARFTRKFPLQFKECFTPDVEDVYFDAEILRQRIEELINLKEPLTMQGDLLRSDQTNIDSEVIFVPKEDGKFYLSFKNFEKYGYKPNNRYIKDGVWHPVNPKFISSGDAFRFNKTTSKGRGVSDGGGSVFWARDKNLDPDDKDVKLWESNRFVCTYQHRPKGGNGLTPKEEYCEDMLMMCEYFGAMMFPERNVADLIDWFYKRKRDGYLLFDVKEHGGKLIYKDVPGYDTVSTEIKDDLFKGLSSHISIHGLRERHLEILQDCARIKGLADMTHYDRFTACCGSIKGLSSLHAQFMLYRSTHKRKFSIGSVYGKN